MPRGPESGAAKRLVTAPSPVPASVPVATVTVPFASTYQWLVYLAAATAGSYALGAINFPAAGIIGPLVVVAALRIAGTDFGVPPARLRTLAQFGLGIAIGTGFDAQTLAELQSSFWPIIAVTVTTVASSMALAGVLQRWIKTDRSTALLACAPAGVAQMGIVADELGAEVSIVNLFQLARLVSTVLLVPILVRLLAGG